MNSALLAWRRHRKPGSIMRPSTFKAIEESARKRGATNPEAVAGAAYWRTAKAKFAKAKQRGQARAARRLRGGA